MGQIFTIIYPAIKLKPHTGQRTVESLISVIVKKYYIMIVHDFESKNALRALSRDTADS